MALHIKSDNTILTFGKSTSLSISSEEDLLNSAPLKCSCSVRSMLTPTMGGSYLVLGFVLLACFLDTCRRSFHKVNKVPGSRVVRKNYLQLHRDFTSMNSALVTNSPFTTPLTTYIPPRSSWCQTLLERLLRIGFMKNKLDLFHSKKLEPHKVK